MEGPNILAFNYSDSKFFCTTLGCQTLNLNTVQCVQATLIYQSKTSASYLYMCLSSCE